MTCALPLHDASAWPLRMTRAEVAYVLRISQRELRRRMAQGRFPKPDDGISWARAKVIEFAESRMREFERSAAQRQRRESLAVVGGHR